MHHQGNTDKLDKRYQTEGFEGGGCKKGQSAQTRRVRRAYKRGGRAYINRLIAQEV